MATNNSTPTYTIRKLKLGWSDHLEQLTLNAGDLYTRTVVSFWRTVRKQDHWLSASAMMRWHDHDGLHAHSADAVVQSFYGALKSWRKRREIDSNVKPPHKRKRYFKVIWKSSAIRLKDGVLRLSNGRGNEPLETPWQFDLPKQVEIGWDGEQYELRACYEIENADSIQEGKTVGIDLGEVHIATAHDGENTWILNGRELRSKRRYQNRLKSQLSELIDVKQRGSRRRKRLIQSKRKQLRRLNNQIHDLLHKQTTRLISTLYEEGCRTLVIGDVREIRQDLDYGRKANQKLHQWLAGKTCHMLTYKAERLGMGVVLQDERYTSQTCPQCGHRHKPNGREYRCPQCEFVFHRDGVGAVNIRQKYLGDNPSSSGYGVPLGIRYQPQMSCSSGGNDA